MRKGRRNPCCRIDHDLLWVQTKTVMMCYTSTKGPIKSCKHILKYSFAGSKFIFKKKDHMYAQKLSTKSFPKVEICEGLNSNDFA